MQVTPEMLAQATRILAERNNIIRGGFPADHPLAKSPLIQTVKDLRGIFDISLREAKNLWDAQAAPPVDPVVEAARRIIDGRRFD